MDRPIPVSFKLLLKLNNPLRVLPDSRIYVDTRLHYMLELSFNEPFFTRGDFPSVVENGTEPIVLQNPWVNGTNATPFDQRKFLVRYKIAENLIN